MATKNVQPEIITNPAESAEAAGLRYVSDEKPGIRRVRRGKSFSYHAANGELITDEKTLERIKSLVIPPAWEDVWISPSPRGHIQATGRDEKGRKQYRYHDRWREIRDRNKYNRMLAFGRALPKIREQVEEDLGLRGMPRRKVLATVVRLLEETLIRVGNEEYARTNGSFGLTTLRNRHVDVSGSELRFHFKGKSGVRHNINVRDRRVARIIKKCQEMPGQELFEYLDEEGEISAIDSTDVNEYLHEIAGEEFTAKDFRTWAGTVMAAVLLRECESEEAGNSDSKKRIVETVKKVAQQLGNTPAVCRKCYIHPAVFELYLDGSLTEALEHTNGASHDNPADLRHDERSVMHLLEEYSVSVKPASGN